MNILAVVLALLVVVSALALFKHRQVRLRQTALSRLLHGADEMERLLARTREQMQRMDGVVRRVPSDIGAQARASLQSDHQVEQALKELLQHRLWIQRHQANATQSELDEACAAMDRALQRIGNELQRLERAGAELDEATEAALAAAQREPPELRRQS